MKKLVLKNRYLAWDDEIPFFYLGDTAWELFHKLDQQESEYYLRERKRQGFTAVQAVALAEYAGLTKGNAYGRLPLKLRDNLPDPGQPDLEGPYSYWEHVDFIIQAAQKQDLFITLLPTWGDKFNKCWGEGPEIFTPENAYVYGKWLADRYQDQPNVIWMLGGDRPLEAKHRRIMDAMARGIREADKDHLITFHPAGGHDSLEYLADADYIDFHTAQTGHSVGKCYESDAVMLNMRERSGKPYMDSEPRYEDHPACFNEKLGYHWNADDIRQNAYWNVLAGACGHTYGNHNIWFMNNIPGSYHTRTWQQSLTRPGAEQVAHVKKLRLSRDYFSLVPDGSLVRESYAGIGHLAAARGKGYAFVYSPLGLPFTVNLTGFQQAEYFKASWFDPRTGSEVLFAILPAGHEATVAPPTQGTGCDWVLILDAHPQA